MENDVRKLKRVNFDFPEARFQELKQLQTDLGIDMKTLFTNALSVFVWCLEETSSGNEIAAVNEANQTYRVLVTPLLQSLRPQHQAERRVQSSVSR